MNNDVSLRPMFSPRSIAIVGASKDVNKPGARPISLLKEGGYKGKVYPINPNYDEIMEYPCLPDIEHLPYDVDLAIVAIKANDVVQSLKKLSERRIKSVVIFSSGFSEAGAAGEQLQRELSAFIKETGIPVCGPNSVGLTNLKEGVFASFTQIGFKSSSPIAFATQSGAFGIITYRIGQETGMGMQYLVSTGNEAGLGLFDYVNYFAQDTDIKVIGGYLEGARDFAKMDRAVKLCLLHKKPLVLLKVGVSEKGAVAAASHTASMAGNSEVYKSYFKRNNVVQVQDEEELIDTLNIFSNAAPPSESGGVAVITISGGAGILMADQCERHGLPLANLSSETLFKLKAALPDFAALNNPIDVTAHVGQEPKMLTDAISITLKDEGVNSVAVYLQSGDLFAKRLIPELSKVVKEAKKTVVICWSAGSSETREMLNNESICWVPTPSRLIKGLSNVIGYHGGIKSVKCNGNGMKRKLTEDHKSRTTTNLNEWEGKQILKSYGISVPQGKVVHNLPEAISAGNRLGYPVVLKLLSRTIGHKSDYGLVQINIANDAELSDAFERIYSNFKLNFPDVEEEGFLVEKMGSEGIEVIVGSVKDPIFGPCVMVGLGGIFVEMVKDFAIAPAPLSREYALWMLQTLKGYRILENYRGKEYDISALVETIVNISQFCKDNDNSLEELDINPVIVHKKGLGVTAVDSLIILKDDVKRDEFMYTYT